MENEYSVTFVYPFVNITTIVWTASEDEDEIERLALQTIFNEAEIDVVGADCEITKTGEIFSS